MKADAEDQATAGAVHDANIQAMEKLLGEPVALDLSEATQKARRNLLGASVVAIAFWWWGLRLSSSLSLLGVQIQNLSLHAFVCGLMLCLVYLFVHFVWLALDALQEWRLRQTGMKVAYTSPGTFMATGGDHVKDPRQSTLHSWWRAKQAELGRLHRIAEETSELVARLKATEPRLLLIPENAAHVSTLEGNIAALGRALAVERETKTELRVPVSLERFDAAFRSFQKSQNLRWMLLDFLTPVLLGAAAMVACAAMLMATPKTEPARTPACLTLSTEP